MDNVVGTADPTPKFFQYSATVRPCLFMVGRHFDATNPRGKLHAVLGLVEVRLKSVKRQKSTKEASTPHFLLS